jgi:hypothetical protein
MITHAERYAAYMALTPSMRHDALAFLTFEAPEAFDAAVVWAMGEAARYARAAADMIPTTEKG